MDDARSYLSRELHGMDMSEVPDEAVKTCVEKSYEGGWIAYEADYHRVMRVTAKPEVELTPFQKWVKVARIVGGAPDRFHLRPHQEVISVDITDDEIKAVVKLARTEERSNRDRVTFGAKLIVWKRTESGWSAPEAVEVWTEDTEEIVRWGRVRTADWVESQLEQYETCFRPGTHKSPMQGPAARLEITREELHDLPKAK
jgi:hypothetical protein